MEQIDQNLQKAPKTLTLLWGRTLHNAEFIQGVKNIIDTMNVMEVENPYLTSIKDQLSSLVTEYDEVQTDASHRMMSQKQITKRYNECRDEITSLVSGVNYIVEGQKRSPIVEHRELAEQMSYVIGKSGGSLCNQSRIEVVLWCDSMVNYIKEDSKLPEAIDKLNLSCYFDRIFLLAEEMKGIQTKRAGKVEKEHINKSIKAIRKEIYDRLQVLINALSFFIDFEKDNEELLELNLALYYNFRIYNSLSKRRQTIRDKSKRGEGVKDERVKDEGIINNTETLNIVDDKAELIIESVPTLDELVRDDVFLNILAVNHVRKVPSDTEKIRVKG